MKKQVLDSDLAVPMQYLTPHLLNDNNIFQYLPIGVYICDQAGIIQKYNDQAVKIWGRQPLPGDKREKYTGSYHMTDLQGSSIPTSMTPVALCIEDGQAHQLESLIERPDHSHVHVRMTCSPLNNEQDVQVGVICCISDITDEVKDKNDLVRKGRELVDYMENATIGLHWVDEDGYIKWANKAELELLGYNKDEYIGHHISEFHAGKEKLGDILSRLHNNEVLYRYQTDLKCKDGSIKTVELTSSVYRENGKFIHTRCFTVDITEQKKLFNQLQESEEKNRSILKNLPAAIYTCDQDGYVSFYNDAAVNLWGREPEFGKDLWCGSWKITRPDGSPLPLDSCPMAVCLKESRSVFGEEIIIIKPNGEKRYVRPHPEPLFDKDGNIAGAVNMLIDITEMREAEKTLRESEFQYRNLASTMEKIIDEKTADLQVKNAELKKSEERYHKMVEEVEDYAIILLDESGHIRNWNKGAEKIKGYKESEIIGKSFQVFYLPQDRESGLPFRLINHARENGKAVHEGWRMRKDGTKFWGSIVLTALHNDKDEIIGFSKVTRDLTERKIHEDKLQEYASQLKFQNEQLEQFAYAASHDMKEPLRKILFYNNHLQETISNSLQEKEREYLNRSINAARRMERLINDLLEYSKASSGAHGFEKVDLAEIVDETLLSYKDVIDEKQASIELSSLPTVVGVPFQLRQVFDNIISNALKYHHPTRKPRISISSHLVQGMPYEELQHDRNYHKIKICDNGIGFEPEYSEKIFELFQRLGTIKYSGTGVGLALCKKIAQNHHGTIKASGKLNEGACFEIYLPE